MENSGDMQREWKLPGKLQLFVLAPGSTTLK